MRVGFYAEFIGRTKDLLLKRDWTEMAEVDTVSNLRGDSILAVQDDIREALKGVSSRDGKKIVQEQLRATKNELSQKQQERIKLLDRVYEGTKNVAGAVMAETDVRKLVEIARLHPAVHGEKIDFERACSMFTFAVLLERSKILRVNDEQLQVFLDLPSVPGQDFTKEFNLPFDSVYVQSESGRDFTLGDTPMKGITLSVFDPTREREVWEGYRPDGGKAPPLPASSVHAGFSVTGLLQLVSESVRLDGTFGGVLIVSKAGDLIVVPDTVRAVEGPTLDRMKAFVRVAVHLINFFNSPGIMLDQKIVDEALQKARAKKGKEPLPGWYEIRWKSKRQPSREKDPGKEPAWHHGFRYDVRGHFKRFERGRMAGRVIWCPPHQRGIHNNLYKPKTYLVGKNSPGTPSEPWGG